MPPAVSKEDKGETTGERGGVQSIERAVAILTEVSRNYGISLADLSRAVGLHSSTTFHLVRTLVAEGMVRQDRETKRYHLGRTIYQLAASASSEVELVSAAMPFLEDLATRTREFSHLALRSGHDIIIAAKVAGDGAFQMTERNGSVRPAHATAVGKVLLAAMGDGQLARYLKSAPFAAFTARTITDAERLRAEITSVRAAGIAYDDTEFHDEVRCLAVPIRDFRGEVVAAAGVSGPVWRLSLPRLHELAAQVKDTCALISRELGHRSGTL